MKVFRSLAVVSTALAISVGSADAQIINFNTTGAFSGAGCSSIGGVANVSVWCDAAGGIRLTYLFGATQTLNGFGNASFGTFVTSGVGPSTFSSVLFALTVNQTTPTPGAMSTSANVLGTLSAIQGGLIWGPVDPSTFFIGTVNYTISRDFLTSGIRIDPPGIGGVNGDPQTIRGFVTTVPEPSTYLLMASGLAAIGVIARRRRRAV